MSNQDNAPASKRDNASRPESGTAEARDSAAEAPLAPQTPPRPSARRLILMTLGLLVVLDVVARLILWTHQSSVDAELAKQYPPNTYVPDFAARQDYRFVNLYTMNPSRGAGPETRFDEMGFRLDRRNLKLGVADGFKHIWMFGGSTTQGLGLRENETIAARLNDLLETAKSEWRVLNLGQGGFNSTQELLLLMELLHAGYRPDAILCYDGINEMPFAGDIAQTGAPGWEKHTAKSSVISDIQGAQSVGALTLLTVTRWTKLDDFLVKAAAHLTGRAGIPPAPTADRGGTSHPGTNWDVVAQRYLLNLNLIRAAAGQLGIPVLLYFQPVMQYEDHYRVRTYSEYETTKLVAQMANNEFARREALYAPDLEGLRKALEPNFHDIYDVFRGHDGETLYADPRHPNGEGTRIIAQRIFADLAQIAVSKPEKGAP
jgi:lysophospholipase L1-like esterase